MCNLTILGGYFKKEIDKIESILQRKGKWVDMRKVCSFTVSSSHQGSPGQSLLRDPPTTPTPQIKPLLDTANKSRWEPKYTFFSGILRFCSKNPKEANNKKLFSFSIPHYSSWISWQEEVIDSICDPSISGKFVEIHIFYLLIWSEFYVIWI